MNIPAQESLDGAPRRVRLDAQGGPALELQEMTAPKLHHYVPQFYLRRFADTSGQLWLWDRHRDRVFHTSPNSIAAENNFYWHEELATLGHDPLIMACPRRRVGKISEMITHVTAPVEPAKPIRNKMIDARSNTGLPWM